MAMAEKYEALRKKQQADAAAFIDTDSSIPAQEVEGEHAEG